MKYAIFDEQGFPLAFYSEDIHGTFGEPDSTIPIDATPISDGQWENFINNQGLRRWENGSVIEFVPEEVILPVESVSARQFKTQLYYDGLLESVEIWINSQPTDVQIAYVNSTSFVKDQPMMQAGFTALGFTQEQIDQFFLNASKL